jgi:hypothetical protein
MVKSFNLILNSFYGTDTGPSSKSFFVDWNLLGANNKKKYEATFTLTSVAVDMANQDIAVIFLDIGQNNSYISQNNTTKISKILGVLKQITVQTGLVFFTANLTDNPPIYLERLSGQSKITVNWQTFLGIPFTQSTGFQDPSYILIINFKEI